MKQFFPFYKSDIQISGVVQTAKGLEMQAKSSCEHARCPDCDHLSTSVHSS